MVHLSFRNVHNTKDTRRMLGDTRNLGHLQWGCPNGLNVSCETLSFEHTSYLWRLELEWWIWGLSLESNSQMPKVISLRGVNWESWRIKKGATFQSNWLSLGMQCIFLIGGIVFTLAQKGFRCLWDSHGITSSRVMTSQSAISLCGKKVALREPWTWSHVHT